MIIRRVWKLEPRDIYILIEHIDNLANGIDECRYRPESWINFLKNGISHKGNIYNELGGNRMNILKKEPLAYISDQYAETLPDPNEFAIPIADLIMLIEEFIQLTKLRPNFIVLSEDNGKFSLEAKETLD